VLSALAAGATRPEEIAAGLLHPPPAVQAALDWAVGVELVTRADARPGPAYSLTPKGRELLGAPLAAPLVGPLAPPQTTAFAATVDAPLDGPAGAQP
jgi:hypothetical protein